MRVERCILNSAITRIVSIGSLNKSIVFMIRYLPFESLRLKAGWKFLLNSEYEFGIYVRGQRELPSFYSLICFSRSPFRVTICNLPPQHLAKIPASSERKAANDTTATSHHANIPSRCSDEYVRMTHRASTRRTLND